MSIINSIAILFYFLHVFTLFSFVNNILNIVIYQDP